QAGHAIGLDTFASVDAIASTLKAAGYDVGASRLNPLQANATARLSVSEYAAATAPLSDRIVAAWGAPSTDASCRDHAFTFPIARSRNIVAAIQPDRGLALDRQANY